MGTSHNLVYIFLPHTCDGVQALSCCDAERGV
jgi:hypothetical protein